MEWLYTAIISIVVTLLGMFLLLRKLGSDIGKAFTNFIKSFTEGALDPNVTRAMSLMGKLGGDSKAQNALKDKMAKGYINKNYGVLKIAAEKILGLDIDDIIEDYGAENVLGAVQQLQGQLGGNGGSIPGILGLSGEQPKAETPQRKWYEGR